jgi:hypothetical protein
LVEFAVLPGGGVDEPAEVVAVVVEEQSTGVGGAVGGKACELGFGELTCGEIGDGDVEVKWSGSSGQEAGPGRDGCVLEGVVMTAEELLQRYAAGERDFSGYTLNYLSDTLAGTDLSNINLSGLDLNDAYLERINLSGANLSGAFLYDVCLDNANLSNVLNLVAAI